MPVQCLTIMNNPGPVETPSRPSNVMAYFIVGCMLVFGVVYINYVAGRLTGVELDAVAFGIVAFKTVVEVLAALYGALFIFIAATYLLRNQRRPASTGALSATPPVAVIYLCCEDLDVEALHSLATLQYEGKLHLIIHDDSRDERSMREVDDAVERLRSRRPEVTLLRRPEREGGKSGAVNYVLDQTGDHYEFFLLCDNDSVAKDENTIPKALAYFENDPDLAVVQFRSMGWQTEQSSPINRWLSRSIDAFDVFMRTCAGFGWTPFIGHNALVKTSCIQEIGGLTLGFFSDDLDATIRLNLNGYRVAYAPHIEMAEKHPPSFESFRRRTYKWAYGCVQVLKKHAGTVVTTKQLTFAEKLSFFQFAGFYVGQTVLLVYLTVTFIVGPLIMGGYEVTLVTGLIGGTLIVIIIFLPVIAYFSKHETFGHSIQSIFSSGLVYGTTDFCCAKGVWDCLWDRGGEWTPTNVVSNDHSESWYWLEAFFGVTLLTVPLLSFPSLLYLPSSYLFAGKFLFAPALSLLYDDEKWNEQPGLVKQLQGAGNVWWIVVVTGALLATVGVPAHGASVPEVCGKKICVNGEPLLIKGIHYGPWRPGTGPNKDYPYPSPEEIEADLQMIDRLNANTILVYDAPDYVLDLARKYDLWVLYVFSVDWWSIGSPDFRDKRRQILDQVEQLKHHGNLLAWVLGNEVPVHVVVQTGEQAVEKALNDLYTEIKEIDPEHLVTHANWPPVRDLDLSFLDFVSFNVYPLWPPDLVAVGYRYYVGEILQPIAGDRPLLISEFGVDTVQMSPEGQAETLIRCWEDLLAADACGGVVFAFADEWWKNYDNPIRENAWWHREPAPYDELTHNMDPEEHYGIVTSYREPKPAFYAVQRMFGDHSNLTGERIVWGLAGTLVTLALASWLIAKRGARRQRQGRNGCSQVETQESSPPTQ